MICSTQVKCPECGCTDLWLDHDPDEETGNATCKRCGNMFDPYWEELS